jgi:hypothetical protein
MEKGKLHFIINHHIDMASIASVPAEVVPPSLLNAFESMRKRQILRQIN